MFGRLQLLYPASLETPIRTRDSNAYLLETLRMSGLNLGEDSGVSRKILRVISYTFFMVILPLSFPINYTIHLAEFPPDLLLQSLQLCLNAWCFTFKYITLAIYTRHLELSNIQFDEMDKFCVKNEEKRKLRESVATVNRLYMLFVVVYILYGTSTLVDALIHDRVPYNTYFPFVNWRIDRTQLYIQCFLEYFIVGYAIFVATATDSYALIFVASLRTHIRLLKDRIVSLGTEGTDADSDFRSLVDCVKAHRTMLKYI